MSLDVLKEALGEAAALEATNSTLKSQVANLNEQVMALQTQVHTAKLDAEKVAATNKAAVSALNATVLERGEQLQDALNALAATRTELAEVKQANAKLSEKS